MGGDSKIEKHGVFAALIMSFPSEFIVFQKDQGKFIHFLDVQTFLFSVNPLGTHRKEFIYISSKNVKLLL